MPLFCSTEQWHHKASQSLFSVQWGTPLFCPFFFIIFTFFFVFFVCFLSFLHFCHFAFLLLFLLFVILSDLSFCLACLFIFFQSFDQRNTAPFISMVIKQLMWLPPRQAYVGFGWLNQEASQSICHKSSQSLGSEKHPSSALLLYLHDGRGEAPPPYHRTTGPGCQNNQLLLR